MKSPKYASNDEPIIIETSATSSEELKPHDEVLSIYSRENDEFEFKRTVIQDDEFIPIAANCYKLPEKRYMMLKEIYAILKDDKHDTVKKIPPGDKSFCYFVLELESAIKHSDGRYRYWDDCGSCERPSGHTHFFDSETKKNVYKKDDRFYFSKQFRTSDLVKDANNVEVIKTLKYKNKKVSGFEKKVTRIEGFGKCIIEYFGNYNF